LIIIYFTPLQYTFISNVLKMYLVYTCQTDKILFYFVTLACTFYHLMNNIIINECGVLRALSKIIVSSTILLKWLTYESIKYYYNNYNIIIMIEFQTFRCVIKCTIRYKKTRNKYILIGYKDNIPKVFFLITLY